MATKPLEETGGYRAQALTRGLAVLRTMADAREPLTLQDIHVRTAIPKPTLVRLLSILTHEACTVRLDDRPTYGLGPTISAIAAGVTDDLDPEELARTHLSEISAATGHTANLGVLSAHQVLHLGVVLPDRPVRHMLLAGTRDDLYCTGLGKALLAQLDRAGVDDALGPVQLTARTPTTLTSRRRLDAELRQIRRQGYAYDDEEGARGLCCFAVPVLVAGRPMAALSVSGPAGELPSDLAEKIVPVLRTAAESVAADLRLVKALAAVTTTA